MTNTTKAPLSHNTIARSASRLWKKTYLNTVIKECKKAGYDVIATADTITIGIIADDMIVLKALKGNGAWLTRFDQKMFDENFEG